MKILVVDDSEALAALIQEMLVGQGHNVITASDGEVAYAVYLLFRPDVIVTDVEMPRTDGPELMKLVRIHEPDIRTIYMSGNARRLLALLDEANKNHCVSILPKPFSRAELVKLVSGVASKDQALVA